MFLYKQLQTERILEAFWVKIPRDKVRCISWSEWVIGVLSRSWQFCSLIATGTRFTKLNGLVYEQSRLCWCMCWTRLALVRPAASLYSASPLKHHATGKQWCPNPDHYSDSEPARRSLTLLCWALSRAAEPQILTSFVWRGRGSNHQPPACQGNSQPLHYPAAVHLMEGKTLMTVGLKIFNTFNTCYINMADNLGNDESFDQASSLDTIFDHFKE